MHYIYELCDKHALSLVQRGYKITFKKKIKILI